MSAWKHLSVLGVCMCYITKEQQEGSQLSLKSWADRGRGACTDTGVREAGGVHLLCFGGEVLSHKLQKNKHKSCEVGAPWIPLPTPEFQVWKLKAYNHTWMELSHIDAMFLCTARLNTPFSQIVRRQWNNLLLTHKGSEIEIKYPHTPNKINI